MPRRFVGEDAGKIGTDHQAAHPGVAAEELVDHRDHANVGAFERRDQRLQHLGAELAREDADRRRTPRRQLDAGSDQTFAGARRAVVGGVPRRVDGGEEAAPCAGDVTDPPVELPFEGPRHADTVLVHRETLVTVDGGKLSTRHDVVLVGGVHEPAPEGREVDVLPVVDGIDHSTRLVDRVHAQIRLRVEPRDPQRDDSDGGQLRVLVENAGERVVEPCSVVDSWAHDDLATDLDAVVEQGPQPAQARRAPAVAQHRRPQLGIRRVDRDVQRRQALGDDPLEVGLGEPGQCREVPVEEAQPVVVVLEVQAAAHPLGQLVDEAELAVVVAGADAVEHGAGHLRSERLAGQLGDRHLDLDAVAREEQIDLGLVGPQLPFDDVTGDAPVEPEHGVTGLHTRCFGGRTRRDGDNDRDTHGRTRLRVTCPARSLSL